MRDDIKLHLLFFCRTFALTILTISMYNNHHFNFARFKFQNKLIQLKNEYQLTRLKEKNQICFVENEKVNSYEKHKMSHKFYRKTSNIDNFVWLKILKQIDSIEKWIFKRWYFETWNRTTRNDVCANIAKIAIDKSVTIITKIFVQTL